MMSNAHPMCVCFFVNDWWFDLFEFSHFLETLIPCYAFKLLFGACLLCVLSVLKMSLLCILHFLWHFLVLLMFFGTSLLCIPNDIHCLLIEHFCVFWHLFVMWFYFSYTPLMCVLDVCWHFLVMCSWCSWTFYYALLLCTCLLCVFHVFRHLLVCILGVLWCFLVMHSQCSFNTSLLCTLNFVDQVPFLSLSAFCHLLIVCSLCFLVPF
jgi:hypothetical protein